MRSLVIISPLSDELSRIMNYWIGKDKELKIAMVDTDRLTISFDSNRYVFVDYLDNGKDHYDTVELNEFVLNNYYYYSIVYSDKETVVDFIFSSSFSEDCIVDNDHGYIVSLGRLTRELLLCIAE